MATAWTGRGLGGLDFPRTSPEEALVSIRGMFVSTGEMPVYEQAGINSPAGALEEKLNRYFQGEEVSFAGIPVDISWCTPFQRQVLEFVRQIAYGELWSYRQVAAAIGRPRAIRAVGGALGENRVPLVIPCHRVVRHDGSPGGFGGGLALKSRLLALEGREPGPGGRYRLTNRAACGNIIDASGL
ncbi:methylated-DNA--[protein]-cysteine S-methyltransferase [Desulfotomaculum copahuensis]|uniref:methylated-DNA--[protein]-cysteine S-methyltransferase n=1 Tax=Desulfotomaculum copahuensis TaxID=1838280 RepID=UPI000AD75E73|nr:methylated-DNA--[protein]-cysteine S-methyltransferase [Desulfotomaculum copahuensis]